MNSFKKILLIFIVGILFISFFQCFFSLYGNIFIEPNVNFFSFFLRYILIYLTLGLQYSLPCFIIFYPLSKLSLKYAPLIVFVLNFFLGIFSFSIVFSFHNLSLETLLIEFERNKKVLFSSGLTGSFYSLFLKWYLHPTGASL